MSVLFYTEPELVIALSKRIIFVNPNDLQIFKEIILPDDLTKCGWKSTNCNDEVKESNSSKEQTNIQHVKMSPDHQMLAVTTVGQKALLLYSLRPEHAQLVSIRAMARVSSALAFSCDSKSLLVADKTGDCYEYYCDPSESVPKLLLGHLSIVYDVLWSHDKKFIITCDRDDKIRVTNYPNTYEIHSYCLGHKEFVAGMELLNNDVLLSISGDRTIKLWNFKEGTQLTNVELPASVINFSIRHLTNTKFEIAVLLHQSKECVATCLLTHDGERKWSFGTPQFYPFNDMLCCRLCYAGDRLFVTGVKNEKFVIKLVDGSPVPLNWKEMVEEQFEIYSYATEDISSWFKKKFDNVSEYLERKKRRIEDKLK